VAQTQILILTEVLKACHCRCIKGWSLGYEPYLELHVTGAYIHHIWDYNPQSLL